MQGVRDTVVEVVEHMTVDYYVYIHSDAWFARTEKVRKRNKGVCECCKMRFGQVVHHRTYEHLGEEKDHELIHLCLDCNSMVHGQGKKKKFFIWPSRMNFLRMLQDEMIKIGLYGREK